MFILQSKVDGRSFEVDQKVIDASDLLMNVCALTDVTEPIVVDCPSEALSLFINLINHYRTLTDQHDAVFEQQLFVEFDDDRLFGIFNELSILDSDFFLDSVADIILGRIDGMLWQELQEYFRLDDDFSTAEREAAMDNKLKYSFTINVGMLAFPFQTIRFSSLRNRFYTPMNVLLARIIQRSNQKTAFHLSLTNKTMKNENDRHPIKVDSFFYGNRWNFTSACGRFTLIEENHAEYVEAITKRKICSYSTPQLSYSTGNSKFSKDLHDASMDFVIPSKPVSTLSVGFIGNEKQIYDFDLKRCKFPVIFYDMRGIFLNFKEFYDQLVAKDLSKEIHLRLHCLELLRVFYKKSFIDHTGTSIGEYSRIHKKPNASRFDKLTVSRDVLFHLSDLKKFIMDSGLLKDYMEEDGIVTVSGKLFDTPNSYNKATKLYDYAVSDFIWFLNLEETEV